MSIEPKKLLGNQLIERNLLTEDQLSIALTEQRKSGQPIGQLLIELGFITDTAIRDVLSETLGGESIDLSQVVPDPDALDLVPKQLASRYKVIPISFDVDDNKLILATTDTNDVMTLDRIRAYIATSIELEPILATGSDILQAIDKFYGYELSVDGILDEIKTGVIDYQSLESEDESYNQPMVRLVNAIMCDAVKRGASDIHFEPESNFLRLRYRIDGVLHQVRSIHKDYWSAISICIKVMADMNIAETRAPQDGRMSLKVGGRSVDFRASVQPTTHGENIVLRVLDRAKGIVPLDQLGTHQPNFNTIKLLMSRPEGIILVTGPTGSGKTTTLYSMLNYRKSIEVNIMTLEDPVEYPMELIRQTSINDTSKLDFASGIRSLMRQDPDIILVGEIRDEATAEMAFRAAMTGHQVYTTLHTNSALGAIQRLIDIGIKNSILAGNIIGVIGQRLLRLLCENCKHERTIDESEILLLGLNRGDSICEAVGCEACNNTGYKGRTSILEILKMDEELDELIAHNATQKQLKQMAIKNGFTTMTEDGIRQIASGRTTIEELARVVDLTARVG